MSRPKRPERPKESVGYKNPPRHAQFKPGQSGNPSGRPKKPKTLAYEFARGLRATVPAVIDGKHRRISMGEAIAKKHINKAASGDVRSAVLVQKAVQFGEKERDNNLPLLLDEFRKRYAANEAEDRNPSSPNKGDDDQREEN